MMKASILIYFVHIKTQPDVSKLNQLNWRDLITQIFFLPFAVFVA